MAVDAISELKRVRKLIEEYKTLRNQISLLEKAKQTASDSLKEYIKKNGEVETDVGSASVKSVSRVSFSGKDLNNLVVAWTNSDIPEIKTCADMLSGYRTVTTTDQLEVK